MDATSLWDIPNLLLQKFPAPEFTATARLTFDARFDGEEAGLVVMGLDYGTISLIRNNGKPEIRSTYCSQADKTGKEEVVDQLSYDSGTIYFRVRVETGAVCTFSYSLDGNSFTAFGKPFKAKPGKWIGAKIGFYALRNGIINDAGYADIDWFRIEK
jgi:hypothetical protein